MQRNSISTGSRQSAIATHSDTDAARTVEPTPGITYPTRRTRCLVASLQGVPYVVERLALDVHELFLSTTRGTPQRGDVSDQVRPLHVFRIPAAVSD
jgi:hypothetical protein